MPALPSFDVRLVHASLLSPSVRELCFERADGMPFEFEAGQWVSLLLPIPPKEPVPESHANEAFLRRSYSIASTPDGSSRFEIIVTRVLDGPGSTYLHGIAPGTVLSATGPQGFFTRPLESAGPALFVGTGTGVAPLRSMWRSALLRGAPPAMALLFGVRNENEILYRDELVRTAAEHPRFRAEVTLSRPDAAWQGRTGYVQVHVRAVYAQLAAGSSSDAPPHVFICGLERMVSGVRAILRKELGLPRQLVHSERYD